MGLAPFRKLLSSWQSARYYILMDDIQQRMDMVTYQIEGRGIVEPRLVAVLRRIPRHRFVPAGFQAYAYEDRPLPIGFGQTISQPYIVALMTDLLHLKGQENVLEVGTGSGYQAAILAGLARQVHTIERQAELAEQARLVLEALEIRNVCIHHQDGSGGLPECAPYQGILVTAAAPHIPPPLLEQLAVGGRLVIPVGGHSGQALEVWERTSHGIDQVTIAPVAFVPLRGAYGWSEEEWRSPPESNP